MRSIGFAVGRTTFREPVAGDLAKTTARVATVTEPARRDQERVGIFEKAPAP